MPNTATRPYDVAHLFAESVAAASERPLSSFAPIPVQDYLANVVRHLNHVVPSDNQVRFGVELEINPPPGESRNDSLCRALQRVFESHPLFIAKRDGSVARGVEIVTLPLDLATHRVLFNAMLPLPARTASNCGVHVHISRAPLTSSQQWRMLQFIHNGGGEQHRFLDQIARRRQNHYCTRRVHRNMPYESGHYDAIGISGRHPTLELRIFASANKPLYLLSYVEFAAALVAYCADENANEFTPVVPQPFMRFVYANRAQYPALYKRISEHAPFADFRARMATGTSDVAASAGSETAARTVFATAVRRAQTRRHPVTRDRERRCRTHVPRTQEVRQWLRDYFGVAADLQTAANQLASNNLGTRAARREYVRWYVSQCWEDTPTGRNVGVTVTQRGQRITAYHELAEDAIYHLRLV